MSISISSAFDGGNIDVVETRDDGARLTIRADHGSEHMMWFCFRVSGARNAPLRLTIENADKASYLRGWDGYRACASYDLEDWFRVPTAYKDGKLTIDHQPESDSCTYAYFAPYSLERHRSLIAIANRASLTYPNVRTEVLGQSVDGRDIDLVTIGADSSKAPVWIIARQHPGETMAEHLAEGLIHRLLDDADPIARALRSRLAFHIVPNMNPDGGFRGHLRMNAAGANLNREWNDPDPKRCPEVFAVRQAMERTGVRFFLDVHGDEGLPYNFLVGPSLTMKTLPDSVRRNQAAYADALVRANPDFQTQHGYPMRRNGEPDLRIATNWVANRFGCLAMTLEQPFKDAADTPDEQRGWCPPRCRHLGRSLLDALWAIADRI